MTDQQETLASEAYRKVEEALEQNKFARAFPIGSMPSDHAARLTKQALAALPALKPVPESLTEEEKREAVEVMAVRIKAFRKKYENVAIVDRDAGLARTALSALLELFEIRRKP